VHLLLRNPGADVLRAGVSSFVGVSTNTATDSRAVGSRNNRSGNRADSHNRNSAVDSHSNRAAMGLKILQRRHVPRYTVTGDGLPGDPVNLALVGTLGQLHAAFATAGWAGQTR